VVGDVLAFALVVRRGSKGGLLGHFVGHSLSAFGWLAHFVGGEGFMGVSGSSRVDRRV